MGLAESYKSVGELSVTLIHEHTVDICTCHYTVLDSYLQIESVGRVDSHLVLQVHLVEQFHASVKPTVRT